MTSSIVTPARLATLAATGLLALGLAACSSTAAPQASTTPSPTETATLVVNSACAGDEGVTVVIDAGALKGGDTVDRTACVITDKPIVVSDALTTLGVTLEGTEQYGDQVVCRVDGLPSATEPLGSASDPSYVESCKTMPAVFGYWSLWLKPAGGAWDYAQEGVSAQKAAPGESVELLFTLDGAPAAPAA